MILGNTLFLNFSSLEEFEKALTTRQIDDVYIEVMSKLGQEQRRKKKTQEMMVVSVINFIFVVTARYSGDTIMRFEFPIGSEIAPLKEDMQKIYENRIKTLLDKNQKQLEEKKFNVKRAVLLPA